MINVWVQYLPKKTPNKQTNELNAIVVIELLEEIIGYLCHNQSNNE